MEQPDSSITIPSGSRHKENLYIALIGVTGAGKSTTVSCIRTTTSGVII